MNTSDKPGPRPASASGLVRRIAVTMILSGLVFAVLWLMAFSIVTSLLASAGFCIVVAMASAASDPVETVLDAIAAVVFGILGAIAAFLRRHIQPLHLLKRTPRTSVRGQRKPNHSSGLRRRPLRPRERLCA